VSSVHSDRREIKRRIQWYAENLAISYFTKSNSSTQMLVRRSNSKDEIDPLSGKVSGASTKRKRRRSRAEGTRSQALVQSSLESLEASDLNVSDMGILPNNSSCDAVAEDWMLQDFQIDMEFADFDVNHPILSSPFDFTTMSPSSKTSNMLCLKSPSPSPGPFNASLGSIPGQTQLGKLITPQIPSMTPPIFPNRSTASRGWGGIPSTIEYQSEKQIIHKLTTINIELSEHIKAIPPMCIHDSISRGVDDCESINLKEHGYHFSLDETFRLIQELIDIYPAVIGTFVNNRPPSVNLRCGNVSNGSASASDVLEQVDGSAQNTLFWKDPRGIDHGTVLLLLSCHVRLSDILDQLYMHIKFCVPHLGTTHDPTKRFNVTSPPLRIGNYQPSPSSSALMQMLLFIQLASQLSNQASVLVSCIRGPQPRNYDMSNCDMQSPHNTAASLSLEAAERVEARANGMARQLVDVRTAILSVGVLG
jgi:hypothetical protein